MPDYKNFKKKRRGRWDYLKDFQPNISGEMIYVGRLYAYTDKAGRPRSRVLLLLLIAGLVSSLSAIGQGFLPAMGMRGCAYVVLPYAVELFSAVGVVWIVVRLFCNKEPLREYIYSATAGPLPVVTLLSAISSGATLLGDGIYLLLNGTPRLSTSLLFLALSLLSLGGGLAARLILRGVSWVRQEQDN